MGEVQGPDGGVVKAYVPRALRNNAKGGSWQSRKSSASKRGHARQKADWLASKASSLSQPDLFWRIKPGHSLTDQSEAEWKQAPITMNQLDTRTRASKTCR